METEMRTLTCPICGKFLMPDDRLIIENYNGQVVIWHVRDWEAENISADRASAEYSSYCGKNFGRAEIMPSLTS